MQAAGEADEPEEAMRESARPASLVEKNMRAADEADEPAGAKRANGDGGSPCPQCEHSCQSYGSRKCTCFEGYKLHSDGRSCKRCTQLGKYCEKASDCCTPYGSPICKKH